jgi:bifunctional non-homologous end joining protein LigD
VTWNEVEDATLRPDGFTLRDVPERLDRLGDPWATLFAKPGSVAAARARLAAF